MTGTHDGEQFAINKLAEWVTTPVRSSSERKVAIKRCLKANIQHTLPQVWSTSLAQRELLQLSWTKGHLDAAQHCQRFLDWRTGGCGPPTSRRIWHAAARALKSSRTSKPIALTVLTRLPERNFLFWAHILASDPVPRFKEAKFEATPVAGRQAKPSGPNKRQRLLAATQGMNAHTGHNWVVTAAAKNLCIKCTVCSLYAQQVDPPEVVDLVLSHPCKLSPWLQQASIRRT